MQSTRRPQAASMCLISARTRSRNLPAPTRNAKDGFTLLEVLLTIILMVAVFVVLLEAFSTGLFSGGENETELVGINLAQEKMEEIRNKSYATIVNEAKAVIAAFPAFQMEVAVTTPQTSLKQVTVNVY